MPTPQRLPIVNSDDGVWGDIIRQYLAKEHYNDDTDNSANGGHKTITIRPGTATAGTAPLKFTSGTLTTAAEAGAMEFNTDSLYFTVTTGAIRKKIAMYDDSLGATGDLYYRNSSGIFTRLPIGATGTVLQASGSVPAWTDPRASNVTTTTSITYTVNSTDTVIFADASTNGISVELPSAATFMGYKFYVKRLDSSGNSVEVWSSGTTVDGEDPYVIKGQYTSITAVSNGSNWFII